ncbi:MAG TPA: DUF4388 domain-containing protein [Thermomicrobiales bacterium]|nr:DUF4388 domain-containing protein [Thermomicrobiales bacterium]
MTSLLRWRKSDQSVEDAPVLRSPAVTGMLTGISLPAMLQMLSFEKRDGVIQVDSRKGSGELTLDAGEIVRARTNTLRGPEAALEILGWPEVTVEIRKPHEPVEREIFQPLHHLLMDSYRVQDEEERQSSGAGGELPASNGAPARVDDLLGTRPAAGVNRDYTSLLASISHLRGLCSAIIFDFDNGLIAELKHGDIEAKVSHFWEADDLNVRRLGVLNAVTAEPGAQDGLLVYSTRYHIFRPMTPEGQVFLYLALDRAIANLVEARQMAQRLKLAASA